MSHTYALLGVSPTAHAEIEAIMRAAGYGHAIEGKEIDMHGLALTPDASVGPVQLLAVTPTLKMLLAVAVMTCTRMDAEITDKSAFRRWITWSTATTSDLIPIDDDAAFIASVDALLAALPAPGVEAGEAWEGRAA